MACRNVFLGLGLSESGTAEILAFAKSADLDPKVAHRPADLKPYLRDMCRPSTADRLFLVNLGVGAICGSAFVSMLRDLQPHGHTHLYAVFPESEVPPGAAASDWLESPCSSQSPILDSLERSGFGWELLDQLLE